MYACRVHIFRLPVDGVEDLTQRDHAAVPRGLLGTPKSQRYKSDFIVKSTAVAAVPFRLLRLSHRHHVAVIFSNNAGKHACDKGRNTCLHHNDRRAFARSRVLEKTPAAPASVDACMHRPRKDDERQRVRSALYASRPMRVYPPRAALPACPSSSAPASRPGTSPVLRRSPRRRLAGAAPPLGRRRSARRPPC